MGTLRLRNCTKHVVEYWRVIAFARKNYVEAGNEGTYYWGATFTLKARLAHVNPNGENSRAGVNPNGIYYAYWANGTLHIYDENQIKAFSSNEDNPHLKKWLDR